MRKKIMLFTTLILSVLIITGCENKAKVKANKNTVDLKGTSVSANEFYDKIKEDRINLLIDMIDHKLFDEKYPTTPKENKKVEDEIANIKRLYAKNDSEKFKEILPTYFGVKTEKELEDKLRLDYKRELAVDAYIEKNIEKREVENYYKNNVYGKLRASHILLKPNSKESDSIEKQKKEEDKTKKLAEEIIKKLNNKEKFDKLAKKYSDDDKTKNKGGDLNFFKSTDMVEEFAEAVGNLKKNEYTKEPIKTKYGYHIILKTDELKKEPLNKIEKSIRKTLRKKKIDENRSLYETTLIDIREENKIKINDPVLAKAYKKTVNEIKDRYNPSSH